MNKPLTALCDHCGKITDVEFKEQSHPNNIKETYFKCEHCFYHYTSFVTDTWVRKKQRHAQHLRSNIRNGYSITNVHATDELMKLQEEINSRMSQLKYNLINFGRADL